MLIRCLTHGWRVPDQLDDENDGEDAPGDDSPARVFHATELFGDSREVWIELDGVRYRLRITRRGKLILQK